MTIKDIARESGYAVSTVSRVLNNHPDVSPKAREAVMAVIKTHHFVPNSNAKRLKQQSSKGIVILVKGSSNILFGSILEEVQQRIKEQDHLTSVIYLDEEANEVERAAQLCRERKPSGLIFLGGNLQYFKASFGGITVPSVLVTTMADGLGFPNLSSISIDDVAGAAKAVAHLTENGHRKIGIIGGRPETSAISELRLRGCLTYFACQNMTFDLATQFAPARFSYAEGYQAMLALLDKSPDLDGVFAMSDVMAIGALRALRDRGKTVPENISVVGYDGIDLVAYTLPKLTTIRQDPQELAKRSVEILFGHLRKKEKPVHEKLAFSLLAGESVRDRNH